MKRILVALLALALFLGAPAQAVLACSFPEDPGLTAC